MNNNFSKVISRWSRWLSRGVKRIIRADRLLLSSRKSDRPNGKDAGTADSDAASQQISVRKRERRSREEAELIKQIREAHLAWVCAHRRLDVVVEKDEVDFAIFALEAAEKRYGLLIKEAKIKQIQGPGAYPTMLDYTVRAARGG